MLDIFGNLTLVCGIFAAGILLIVVNVNYTPSDEENKDEDR